MIWKQRYFKDAEPFTPVKEIHLWLEQMPGEVKHFGMTNMGSLIVAVVGYEQRSEETFFEHVLPPLDEGDD